MDMKFLVKGIAAMAVFALGGQALATSYDGNNTVAGLTFFELPNIAPLALPDVPLALLFSFFPDVSIVTSDFTYTAPVITDMLTVSNIQPIICSDMVIFTPPSISTYESADSFNASGPFIPFTSVPEPHTIVLLGAGLLGLITCGKHRKKA